MTYRIITALSLAGIGGITLLSPYMFALLWLALSLWIVCIEWPRLAPWYTALFYPIPLLGYALWLYVWHEMPYVVWYGTLSAIIYDSSAYYIGRYWGKHYMTHISPKKTWEGTCGGFCMLLIALIGAHIMYTTPTSYTACMIISIALSSASCIGDLSISWLKRYQHIKDCSNLLPGHGGALDRCDSILLAIPTAHILTLWTYL